VAFLVSQDILGESVLDVEPHTLISHGQLAARQWLLTVPIVFPYFEERKNALTDYFKFVMYRHPIERLASAYRDKIDTTHPQYRPLRQDIFLYAHPNEKFTEGPGKARVGFHDFVSYWLDHYMNDEHFIPTFELCEPCKVRYTYYGQFKTFKKHALVFLDMIGGKKDFLLEDNYSNPNEKTESVLQELYNGVSDEAKRRVLKRLSQDIDFYYHIYPDELNTHKKILNLSDELTIPYLPMKELPIHPV